MSPATRTQQRWFPPAEFYAPELCTRCGVCCGATDGHPCEHLVRGADGTFLCEIYENRLGPHRTVDGHRFACATIKQVIETTGGYAGCAYVEQIRRMRKQLGQPTDDLGRLSMPEDV